MKNEEKNKAMNLCDKESFSFIAIFVSHETKENSSNNKQIASKFKIKNTLKFVFTKNSF